MLGYVKNVGKCRNIQLLKYFGESKYKECGGCDVCTRKNKRSLSEKSYKNIELKILTLLKNYPLDIRKILLGLPGVEEQKILEVLKKLVENKKIKINSSNCYQTA